MKEISDHVSNIHIIKNLKMNDFHLKSSQKCEVYVN